MNWLWNFADFNGDNKVATNYVESNTTVHVLFFDHTGYDGITKGKPILDSFPNKAQNLLWLCTVKVEKR